MAPVFMDELWRRSGARLVSPADGMPTARIRCEMRDSEGEGWEEDPLLAEEVLGLMVEVEDRRAAARHHTEFGQAAMVENRRLEAVNEELLAGSGHRGAVLSLRRQRDALAEDSVTLRQARELVQRIGLLDYPVAHPEMYSELLDLLSGTRTKETTE